MKKLLVIILLLPGFGICQPLKVKKTYGGIVSLGVRTTISTFNGGDFGNTGIGAGGQARIQVSDRVNTDWFFDYITANIGDFASRTDYHIGWSVLFYPTKKADVLIRPYILAGHCFDHTQLRENADFSNNIKRGSSAVQAGGGFHLNLSQRMDISFTSQYMIHLGEDIHAERLESGVVAFEKHKGAGLEGHLLFNIGINYKIADLW